MVRNRWLRKSVIALAVAAIAVASCYSPQFAHAAAMHAAGAQTAHAQVTDGHPHATPCHDEGESKEDVAQSKYCCAAACAASAFIFSTFEFPDVQHRMIEAALLIEQLRSVVPASGDPPPRIG